MSSRSSPAKKVKVVESTTNPNWLELPRDITEDILQRLGAFTILTTARKVCSLWWNICKNPFMWRIIHMGTDYIYLLPQCSQNSNSLEKMCRYAVDLSCGHLEDISIYRFGTDNLLNYIADSANHLGRVCIDNCILISNEGICEVAKKLPLIEEFHVTFGYFSENALEVLGRSCPLLKSLKYTGMSWKTVVKRDNEALAIAKTMPRLCYLDINGNPLSDVGLTAILDGCPLLDTLDIRECPNLDFSGDLCKRCHDQIKDLRRFVNYSDYLSDFDADDEYEEYYYYLSGFDFGTNNKLEDYDYLSEFLSL